MKNKLILTLIISFFVLAAKAQENDPGPKKGTKIISLLIGKNQSFGNWLVLPAANQTAYSIQTPGLYPVISDNPATNMIGIEGKWFFARTLALRVSGMGNISAALGYEGVPGISDSNGPSTLVPFYSGVPSLTNHEVLANLGIDKYFATRNKHLFWYLAPVLNFHYNRLTGQNSADFVPTTSAPYFQQVDPGTIRYSEALGAGLSAVFGVEYFTTGGLVFGFEAQGANYTYLCNSQVPMEGLSTLKSDTHNVSFFTRPTLKIGFKF
jgi:hypothetical protein